MLEFDPSATFWLLLGAACFASLAYWLWTGARHETALRDEELEHWKGRALHSERQIQSLARECSSHKLQIHALIAEKIHYEARIIDLKKTYGRLH